MGTSQPMRVFKAFRSRRRLPPLSTGARRIRPRDYLEWKTLREWNALPPWELEPPGYLLRVAREGTSLTQRELAERLGVSQQAVARVERWDSNPTVAFLRRWAEACGAEVTIEVRAQGASER
jgi:DNA-binding XRE family transcriptional regulator